MPNWIDQTVWEVLTKVDLGQLIGSEQVMITSTYCTVQEEAGKSVMLVTRGEISRVLIATKGWQLDNRLSETKLVSHLGMDEPLYIITINIIYQSIYIFVFI